MTRDAEHTPTGYEDAASVVVNQAPAPAGGEVQWGWRVRSKPGKFSGDRPWHWQIDEPTGITAENCEYEPVYTSILAALSPEAPARKGVEVSRQERARRAWHLTPTEKKLLARLEEGPLPFDEASALMSGPDAARTFVYKLRQKSFDIESQRTRTGEPGLGAVTYVLVSSPPTAALTPRHEAPASHAFEASHSVQREGGCKVCGHDEASHEAPAEGAGELWPVGSWLSAALDDPSVCAEMKADIREWFDNGGHLRARSSAPEAREAVAWVGSEELSLIRGGYQTVTATLWGKKISGTEPLYTHPAHPSADHAELMRLAEAASAHLAGPNLNTDGFGLQIWGDSFKGGRTHVLDVRGWGYLTGGGHGALGLSEDDGIAAQRAIQAYVVAAWNAVPALLSEIAALRGERDRLAEELHNEIMVCAGKSCDADVAERQRDELRKALEEIADEAPYRSGYCQSDVEYGPALSADEMQAVARQALANQGAE